MEDSMEDNPKTKLIKSMSQKPSRRTAVVSRRTAVVAGLLLVVALAVAIPLGIVYSSSDDNVLVLPTVAAEDIMVHLRELENVANAHPSKSRSIINAYNASFDYVKSQLDPARFTISEQHFKVPAFSLVAEPNLTFTTRRNGQKQPHRCFGRTGWQRYETVCDFASVRYGGNTIARPGNVNGKLTVTGVPVMVDDACNPQSYTDAGVVDGTIVHVILAPSNCTAFNMVTIAEAAGAAAVLLENSGSTGIPGSRIFDSDTWFPSMPRIPDIPTIGIAPQLGSILRITNQEISLEVNSIIVIADTKNLIADARFGGNSGDVLMVGAHLDSVPEGPGINDNGSGSASILAIAQKLAASGLEFKNGMRFAWWGAEEIGLMGSRFYVEGLENTVNVKPALYLNFDMEAAPNAVRGVHNGASLDRLPVAVSESVRNAAFEAEQLFLDEFDRVGLATQISPMSGGGSDFYPFLMGDIAAGGLATGAGGIKRAEERAAFGGLANAAMDPCYHASCDTTDNIGIEFLGQMSSAMMGTFLKILRESDMSAFYATTERGKRTRAVSATSVRANLKKSDTNGKYCGGGH